MPKRRPWFCDAVFDARCNRYAACSPIWRRHWASASRRQTDSMTAHQCLRHVSGTNGQWRCTTHVRVGPQTSIVKTSRAVPDKMPKVRRSCFPASAAAVAENEPNSAAWSLDYHLPTAARRRVFRSDSFFTAGYRISHSAACRPDHPRRQQRNLRWVIEVFGCLANTSSCGRGRFRSIFSFL